MHRKGYISDSGIDGRHVIRPFQKFDLSQPDGGRGASFKMG